MLRKLLPPFLIFGAVFLFSCLASVVQTYRWQQEGLTVVAWTHQRGIVPPVEAPQAIAAAALLAVGVVALLVLAAIDARRNSF